MVCVLSLVQTKTLKDLKTQHIAICCWIFTRQMDMCVCACAIATCLILYDGFIATTNSNNYRYFSIPFELSLIIISFFPSLSCHLWAHIRLVHTFIVWSSYMWKLYESTMSVELILLFWASTTPSRMCTNINTFNLNNWFDVGVMHLLCHVLDMAKSCTIHMFYRWQFPELWS